MREPLPEDRHRWLVDLFEREIPFNAVVGLRVEGLSRGYAVLRIPWRDDLVGDPGRMAVHGGVTSMLVDTTGGAACFAALDRPEDRVSTVDLRVDYLRPGLGGDLWCEAEVVRLGNRVGLARSEVFVGGLPAEGEPRAPIATGHSVYNIVRKS